MLTQMSSFPVATQALECLLYRTLKEAEGHHFADKMLTSLIMHMKVAPCHRDAMSTLTKALDGMQCFRSLTSYEIIGNHSCLSRVEHGRIPIGTNSIYCLPHYIMAARRSILQSEAMGNCRRLVSAWHPPSFRCCCGFSWFKMSPEGRPLLYPKQTVCQVGSNVSIAKQFFIVPLQGHKFG